VLENERSKGSKQRFLCGSMASKWVGLNWTPEMIATDRRGKLAGSLALAMQLIVPWVLHRGTPSTEKPGKPILFSYTIKPEKIRPPWRCYLFSLAVSASATMVLLYVQLAGLPAICSRCLDVGRSTWLEIRAYVLEISSPKQASAARSTPLGAS